MSWHRGPVTVGVASALLLAACTGTGAGSWESEHPVVQFTYSGLEPETARVAADGRIRWVNLSPDSLGVVWLPDATAAGLTCRVPATWTRVQGGVQSPSIEGPETSDVTLPCPLQPGSYAYEVRLEGVGFGDEVGPADKTLRGTLVVE